MFINFVFLSFLPQFFSDSGVAKFPVTSDWRDSSKKEFKDYSKKFLILWKFWLYNWKNLLSSYDMNLIKTHPMLLGQSDVHGKIRWIFNKQHINFGKNYYINHYFFRIDENRLQYVDSRNTPKYRTGQKKKRKL